jgi:SAM-dependent methyltransferase
VEPAVVEILRCPQTNQRLRWMTSEELARERARTERPWSAGVTTPDGATSYPVENDIFALLPGMAGKKRDVQQFYDEVGWKRDGSDKPFGDAELFEDLREVSRDYIAACHARVNRHLTRPGRYIVDVASGPVQYPDYLAYGEGFDYRICIDLSRSALEAAREKLGDRGIYILGDITNLPLQTSSVDAVISLHTIYHVPADEQATAFLELERILKPGRTGVVVYAWDEPLLTKALLLPAWPLRKLARAVRKLRGKEPLYFHPHTYEWFTQRDWPFSARVLSWRSLSVLPMRAYVHDQLGGRVFLRGVQLLEERFPELMGRIGHYPLIVMEKS